MKKELEKLGARLEKVQTRVDKAEEVRDELRAELKTTFCFKCNVFDGLEYLEQPCHTTFVISIS